MTGDTLEAYDGEEPYFFVCYSHTENDLVLSEMRWLHDAGVRLWYDERIEIGTAWRRALAEALDNATGLIFMCSAQSIASTHCQKEVSYALDQKKPVLVVKLDDAELTPELALYLNDTQLLERDKYQPAVYRQKLLSALSRHTTTPIQAHTPDLAVKSRRLVPIAAAAAIAVLIGFGSWYSSTSVVGGEPETARQEFDFPKVAIMPMEVLTEDKALNYLARASGEDLRQRMQASIYEPVNVPDSALGMAPMEIGQKFDVDYVWYRSVGKQGVTVRVAKRLAETREGGDVRTFQHDLEGADPFELQDQLSKYAEEIMWAVDQGETERVDAIPMENMNARDLIYTSKGNAKENHRRALELSPDLYSANSAVAWDLFWGSVMKTVDDPDAARAEALRLARRGWQLAPFDQYASEIAASVEIGVGNPQRAVQYVRAFFEFKSLKSRAFYSVLISTNRVQEALAHAKNNPIISESVLGDVYLAAGRYEEAVVQFEKVTRFDRTSIISWMSLANAYGYLDRKEDVELILAGLRQSGAPVTIASFESGVRLYWGQSEFADTAVGGFKRLGYE